MKPLTVRPVFTAVVALCACVRTPATADVPAILVNAAPSDRAELAQVVAEALNRPTVLLADDALLHEDVLTVGRHPRREAAGDRLKGRDLDRPDHFRLVRDGTHCVLVHEGSERRWTLLQPCAARKGP